jgi:hypothetical protein
MKFGSSVVAAAVLTGLLTASASAQDAVRPRWNYEGSAVCPRDYVFQDGLCISIYSGRYRGNYGGAYPGPGRIGAVTRPWLNRNGELQCPTDYVLDAARNCVSIYAGRGYY